MIKTPVIVLFVILWVKIAPIAAYSRVATYGNISDSTDEVTHRPREGVSVARLLIPDLNTTESPTTTTTEPETGRAVDSRPFRFPFMASGATRRTQSRPPARTSSVYGGAPVARKQPQLVYPVYTPSNHRPAQWPANQSHRVGAVQGPVAMDRYSPAEAYSAGIYKAKQKKKEKNGYNYPKPAASFPQRPAQRPAPAPAPAPPPPTFSRPSAPTFSAPAPGPSFLGPAPGPTFSAPAPAPPAPVYRPAPAPPPPTAAPPAMQAGPPQNSYIPPSDKDLYAFPPNVNSPYLPSPDAPMKSISPVSSYLPPAAGPADSDGGFKFPGPVNPMYLPMDKPDQAPAPNSMDSDDSNDSDSDGTDDQTAPPPADMDSSHDHDHDHDHDHYPDFHDHHFSGHFHDHDHDHEVIYDKPPPGYFDHHYSDHHYSDHHYFDHPPATPAPAPETPAPTEAPAPAPADVMDNMGQDDMGAADAGAPFPDSYKYSGLYGVDASPELIYDHDPHHDFHHHHVEPTTTTEEPPPEPRVKKYSYYYLGRKLWYIPLYFTVWFTFYVAALIIRSIARHKVEIPEHYQARRKRDVCSHRDAVKKVDRMTVFVMTQIEDFAQKYLQ